MRHTFPAMGTVVSLEAPVGADAAAVEAAFAGLEALCSRWLATSDVSRIRAGMPLAEASDELQSLAALAQSWEFCTAGAFRLGEGADFDLDGIVKAVAIARGGAVLDAFDEWSIAAGGDVLVSARASDALRTVGIAAPTGGLLTAVQLPRTSHAIATSGISERGEHILGRSDILQASVIAPDIIGADVLATAIVASRLDQLDALLAAVPDADALVVTNDGGMVATEGMRAAIAAASNASGVAEETVPGSRD